MKGAEIASNSIMILCPVSECDVWLYISVGYLVTIWVDSLRDVCRKMDHVDRVDMIDVQITNSFQCVCSEEG